jgi:hypothetical protein
MFRVGGEYWRELLASIAQTVVIKRPNQVSEILDRRFGRDGHFRPQQPNVLWFIPGSLIHWDKPNSPCRFHSPPKAIF